MSTTKLTLFVESKDESDTKEGTGKSTCIACTALWQKVLLRLKQHQTVKKSSLYVVLAIVELRESEGIRQAISYSVSQSVENSVQ